MLRRRRADRSVEASVEQHEGIDPPDGARNLIFLVFDSLRYDTWTEVGPQNLARLGPLERRYSYASWTAPSHYNMLMGLLPHASPPKVYASEYYKNDFLRYSERLNIDGIEFRKLLPSIFLPTFLKHSLGYSTHAMVSMPVLNHHTPINRDFDTYELMPRHNDMSAMLDKLTFEDGRPSFHLLNVGETHYPYALPDEDPDEWPRISGAHGVLKRIDDPSDDDTVEFFDEKTFTTLRSRQADALRYLDDLTAKLYELAPPNTWIVVTSDHGELFGEDGYFGHGPIAHEKVFEVPYVEGLRP
jgi:hypothetical protein